MFITVVRNARPSQRAPASRPALLGRHRVQGVGKVLNVLER